MGLMQSLVHFWKVLEAAYTGNFDAAPLRFGEAISNRVEKAGCQYYVLDLTQRHIDQVCSLCSMGSVHQTELYEVVRELKCISGIMLALNRDTHS